MSKYNLKTGDILLYDYKGSGIFGYFSKLIEYFTESNYSHVSIILKDPTFIHPSLKGYYVWQSSWTDIPDSQDNKLKLGVQITPFEEVYNYYKDNSSSIYVRRIECKNNIFNYEKMSEIHNVVYNKPYDIIPTDWIQAYYSIDYDPQKTNRFWCSALVGYIYTMCGLLNKNTDWSILKPSDFSSKGKLDLINSTLMKEEQIL